MIELVGDRVIDILKSKLPAEIALMKTFMTASDTLRFGESIAIQAPRNDDAKNTGYFLGEPEKIADFPAIVLEPVDVVFEDTRAVSRNTFQYEDQNFVVTIYWRGSAIHPLEYLRRGLIRITDCVINILRLNGLLSNPDTGGDRLAVGVNIGRVSYSSEFFSDDNTCVFKYSKFALSYTVIDSIRQKYIYG